MNVEFYMAARSRIVYDKQQTLVGAVLGKADSDPIVETLENAFALYYGNKVMSPLDALEHKVAECVDAGQNLPVSNTEAFQAAKWIAQEGMAALPSPMPRAFVLYFAKAMSDEGQFPTMEAALEAILANKQFV